MSGLFFSTEPRANCLDNERVARSPHRLLGTAKIATVRRTWSALSGVPETRSLRVVQRPLHAKAASLGPCPRLFLRDSSTVLRRIPWRGVPCTWHASCVPVPGTGWYDYPYPYLRGEAMDEDTRGKATARLMRISGQVTGIQRMVEEDRYCLKRTGNASMSSYKSQPFRPPSWKQGASSSPAISRHASPKR